MLRKIGMWLFTLIRSVLIAIGMTFAIALAIVLSIKVSLPIFVGLVGSDGIWTRVITAIAISIVLAIPFGLLTVKDIEWRSRNQQRRLK